MNRILTLNITDTQQLNLLGRTLDFVQDSFNQQDFALLGALIGRQLSGEILILQGCEISFGSGTIIITAGYVAIDSEIYKIEAQTYIYTNLGNVGFVLDVSFQDGEPTMYTDGISRDTNSYRKLKLGEPALGGITYTQFKRYNRKIQQNTTGDSDIFTSITGTNASSIIPVIKAVKKGDITILSGSITFTSTSITPPIFTLTLKDLYKYYDLLNGAFVYTDVSTNISGSGIVAGNDSVQIFLNMTNPTTASNQYVIKFNITYDNLNIG